MAFVEAACVITLKQLYYPEGWAFPFHPIPDSALFLEQLREAATLLMIAAVSLLGRPPWRESLARGLWIFGVWDLLYYLFLRLWTGFPRSLFERDVVFLIPQAWIAPEEGHHDAGRMQRGRGLAARSEREAHDLAARCIEGEEVGLPVGAFAHHHGEWPGAHRNTFAQWGYAPASHQEHSAQGTEHSEPAGRHGCGSRTSSNHQVSGSSVTLPFQPDGRATVARVSFPSTSTVARRPPRSSTRPGTR